MDFANERYVRLYTRETTTYKRLCWAGQAMLAPMLRLVNRTGSFTLGGMEPAEAVALYLTKWPLEIVSAGLADLLDKQVFERKDDTLVWPKFKSAQDAAQTPSLRKREWRARKRDETSRKGNKTSRERDAMERRGTKRPASRSYPQAFQQVWITYPKRAGSNPKELAFDHWQALLSGGATEADLVVAVERYARFCKETGKIGTENVQQMASFFGAKKAGWTETWELPAEKPVVAGRKLRLASGRVIDVRPGTKVTTTDAPDASDAYELPNGTLSVKVGASWVRT